ncbi:hypothetical protein KAFR_0K00230 [Kazachstania africana CBS 2517]|uniref:Thiamine phosphate synthase/TenI domain-containing protein n=1 Tax=Kazachstania africana (strain ATCC 22294 / BCRC 22015 / CBS 2517 / CECT 1963 / NBRC 1671 / NRRL Y-8276) TaxID=1071382 RepID=H2B178_KAZAF|nr:hypothetical protein KAFR_0K00230 [Kazachstania africana CBS 2517]CCF60378.1 hypothetical protein KAFR_0K00230 [Kazachstania africana CBS 2517]
MICNKNAVDYSLYLVTDSSMLPPNTSLYSQIEAGLKNGVTVVQVREKDSDTGAFIDEAVRIKELCTKYQVPLMINDRVDVAMAIDADGVHVGQDDMPIPMVRKLLGPDKIIGWSVGKVEEVETLAYWGPEMVDYIGVGTVFPTETKKNTKIPMGPRGVARILTALEDNKAEWCRTVAIGGLHPTNIERVLYQSFSQNGKRSLDGIAVVSDIMAAPDAGAATKRLQGLLKQNAYHFIPPCSVEKSDLSLHSKIKTVISNVNDKAPLIHHITNKVHQNFGANVTLSLGSSPIMSEIESEAQDLAELPHAALLLNTGSVAPVQMVKTAIAAYNKVKKPIVFDPVGYSATETRLLLNNTLLSHGQFTCIKGNIGEILSLANMSKNKMKGVDSGDHIVDKKYLALATKTVAYNFRTVAVCTGEDDFIADGTFGGEYKLGHGLNKHSLDDVPCLRVENGPIPIMGQITASGCSLGTTIACFLGGYDSRISVFETVTAAVMLYKSAGFKAASLCQGTASFQVHLVDTLYNLFQENSPETWTAKVSVV